MLIDKIIIHKHANTVITLAYSDDTLFTQLRDDLTKPNTESIFIGKLTRINQASMTAFIQYHETQSGFINLTKKSAYQVGSMLCTQLTWLGNENKQPKLRSNFELIGKYIIYHKNSTTAQLKAKQLSEVQLEKFQQAFLTIPGSWIIRSKVTSIALIDEVVAEATQLYSTAKQIEVSQQKTGRISCIYSGTPNYLKIIRELNLAENCEIITNDQHINQELLEKQDLWLIDAITYNAQLDITTNLEDYHNLTQHNIFKVNNTCIEYGYVAGIHIFDINDSYNNQSHSQTNFAPLEAIYQQIILRNLQGIILLDIIKNTPKTNEQKILQRLTQLFKNDISHTQVLGISNSGLVELIRNKY